MLLEEATLGVWLTSATCGEGSNGSKVEALFFPASNVFDYEDFVFTYSL